MSDENRNDLVLSPNEYAYVLDTTKGQGSYAATVESIILAISPDLIAAMQANSNAETLQQVSKDIAPLAIAKNEGVAETINTLLRGTSLENVFDSLVKNYGRFDK